MRKTGRTTKQLLNMLQGDVIVLATYKDIEHTKGLVAGVLRIHPNSIKYLSVGDLTQGDRWRGFIRSATFHIDHGVADHLFRISETQRAIYYEVMAKISERHKVVTWESMNQQGKQDA